MKKKELKKLIKLLEKAQKDDRIFVFSVNKPANLVFVDDLPHKWQSKYTEIKIILRED